MEEYNINNNFTVQINKTLYTASVIFDFWTQTCNPFLIFCQFLGSLHVILLQLQLISKTVYDHI